MESTQSTPESSIREKWEQAQKKTSEWAQDARERTADAAESAQDAVRENPGVAIGIAALTGAALGYFVVQAFARERTVEDRFSDWKSRGSSALETVAEALCAIRQSAEKAIRKIR